MTRRQLNLLEMYQAVLSHLDKFSAVWNQLAPFTPVVESLKKTVAEMLAQSQLQAQYNPAGYTKRKDAYMLKIVEHAFQLSLKLRSYAKVSKNHVLQQAVDLSYSTLSRSPQQLVLQRCQRIAQHARDHLPELVVYQVIEEEVTMQEQLLKKTEQMTAARNVIMGSRKTATGNIPELVAQARKALDTLDDLVEGMIDDVTFVSTYFNVRQVNERVGRSAMDKEKK